MKKIEVELAGGKRILTVKSPKRKDYKGYLEVAEKLMKNPNAIKEFESYKDNLVIKLAGLTLEEVNDLTQEDFTKLISYIEGQVLPNKKETDLLKK